MTNWIKNMLLILFILLALATAYLGGWLANGWRLEARIKVIETEAAEERSKAENNARKAEQTHAQAIAQIDKKNTEKLKNERARNAAVIADLRRGALQLQDRFTCTDNVSEAGTSTGLGDGKTKSGLQLEDAEFFVSEAGRADRIVMQLETCQQILDADRSIDKREESDGQQ